MRIGRYRFRPAWWPTLTFLLILPGLISLGLWQLSRAEEMNVLLEQQRQALTEPPMKLSESTGDLSGLRYRRVIAKGEYDSARQFLVDNQVHKGTPGFLVMTPLKLKGGVAVLVNRGWVPMTADREPVADIALTVEEVEISGRVNAFPSVGYRLKGAEIPTAGWPAMVQVVDPDYLGEVLGYPLLPFQIQLDGDFPEGFERDWKIADAFNPDKHIGYAVQWFALAAALAVIFLWRSFKV